MEWLIERLTARIDAIIRYGEHLPRRLNEELQLLQDCRYVLQLDADISVAFRRLAAKQELLGAEFERALHDNIEQLYITDDLPAPPIQQEG